MSEGGGETLPPSFSESEGMKLSFGALQELLSLYILRWGGLDHVPYVWGTLEEL